MADQFEVIFFQTEASGSPIVSVNGIFLTDDDPISEMRTKDFIEDLGMKGFRFVSQISVRTLMETDRLNWVFERLI